MLNRRALPNAGFGRRDLARLVMALVILAVPLSAILVVDLLPTGLAVHEGDLAPADIRAPRSAEFTSQTETDAARQRARDSVPPQYDYTPQKGQLSAAQQSNGLIRTLAPVDAAFAAFLSDAGRRAALAASLPALRVDSRQTLESLDRPAWETLRREMQQVLEEAQRQEIRDSDLAGARAVLADRFDPALPPTQRQLGADILSPLLVANSTYDAALTEAERVRKAAEVQPVTDTIQQGELLVQESRRITRIDFEKLQLFGLLQPRADALRLGGWFLLALLAVGLLLAWMWRFRPQLWHRTNVLLLVGLLLLFMTGALRVTAGRPLLPFVVPTAAAGMLIAILLDGGAGVLVMAMLGVLAAVIGNSVELGVYVFLGGLAGIIAVRRGERLAHFFQAAVVMGLVNMGVVTVFALLGDRDLTGVIQLWAVSLAAGGGAAVAAVGSFAVLGNVFGITTSFQLLELANPSQPLLRRLLMETSGTYHHSLMVGNLGERAAEAIGADPLITRVAAYYHDIGKLANPLAFIENQGTLPNVHDELPPEQSAAILKAHVANGIDLAYEYALPTAVIAFIPQHHGTALMSYFYARAREHAVQAAGARPGTPQAAEAEATVDEARFRHVGPKPQSREAAILMLADSVEASVRSLTSHDEPQIRAMVGRIIRERLEDGQFDECDLTLRDLERVREAFVSQLLGVYHRRIEYPQNKIVELESRRAASGGGQGA